MDYLEIIKRQNFLSCDHQTAISSEGEYFVVGETVAHEDEEAGTAEITSFEFDKESNEVKAHTTKGWAHLDFLVKLYPKTKE